MGATNATPTASSIAQFPPNAFDLTSKRKRRPGEIDRFHWYCPKCDTLPHEERFVVSD